MTTIDKKVRVLAALTVLFLSELMRNVSIWELHITLPIIIGLLMWIASARVNSTVWTTTLMRWILLVHCLQKILWFDIF